MNTISDFVDRNQKITNSLASILDDIQNKINECKNKINYYDGEISYWRSRYYDALEAESESDDE